MRGFNARSVVALIATLLILVAGCGSGISIVVRPQPSESFRQDVVDVDCYTRRSGEVRA